MAKLHDLYKQEVIKKLMDQFHYKTVMQVPRLVKITLNMGVGEALTDKKILENAAADMAAISGQKPLITKARKSIADFKIREGYPIGCKVTLRGENVGIPRASHLHRNAAYPRLPRCKPEVL